jgi:hypothetical protein
MHSRATIARKPDDQLGVEDDAWPLLLLSFPRAVTTVTLRGVIDAFERAFDREERFTAVIDCTAIAHFPGAQERKMLADWLTDKRRTERERRWNIGSAVVVPSGPMRALLSAFNLMRRPVAPQHWTATLTEGIAWSRARLLDLGIPLNARIDARHAAARAAEPKRASRRS